MSFDYLNQIYNSYNGFTCGTGSLCCYVVEYSGNDKWYCLGCCNTPPTPPPISTTFVTTLPQHPNGAYQTMVTWRGLTLESYSATNEELAITMATEVEQMQQAFRLPG